MMYFDKTKIYYGQRNKIKERKIEPLISNYLQGLHRKKKSETERDRQADRQTYRQKER